MILLLLNMLLQYSVYLIKTLSLDQMRMGWKRHDSVDKQMLLKEKIFSWEFQVILFTPFC